MKQELIRNNEAPSLSSFKQIVAEQIPGILKREKMKKGDLKKEDI